MSPVLQVWPKPSCKAQWKGEEDKADRGRGGKTTSGNGQAWSSAGPRGQWRTRENGENCLQNYLWCPSDPRSKGIDDDDDVAQIHPANSFSSVLHQRLYLHEKKQLDQIHNVLVGQCNAFSVSHEGMPRSFLYLLWLYSRSKCSFGYETFLLFNNILMSKNLYPFVPSAPSGVHF